MATFGDPGHAALGVMSGGGLAQYPTARQTPIGTQYGDNLWDPTTQQLRRTGKQIGTNAGEALKALQEASGLPLLGSSSSSGTGVGAGGTGPFTVGGTFPTIPPPDTTAANAAVFARAKDQAGLNAKSAMESLRGQLAGRGLLGSGIEGGETARIVGQAAGGLGDLTREQAIQDASNLAKLAQTSYQGGITQRGQDISARGQELDFLAQQQARQAQAMQGLLSVLPSDLLY